MKWVLSDGTKVRLGGKVEGNAPLARKLREDAQRAADGFPRSVCSLPSPGTQRLDLDDPWRVDCWVRDEATRYGVFVTEAPEVQAPPDWDDLDAADPDLGADPIN